MTNGYTVPGFKKQHHTVIVVGGGPAGSAAAHTLAKNGIDTCVVDKAVFPRDKLCGGLLTQRCKNIFELVFDGDWSLAYEFKTDGVKFFNKGEMLNSVDGYSDLYFTKRFHFDDYLMNMAKKQGATSYQNQRITSIDLDKKNCVTSSGKHISYDYIIGADGVNSIVAKSIFGKSFNKKTIGFALEVEVGKELLRRDVSNPEIYFGIVRWGYGWVFPKDNTLTVGVGGLHMNNPDMRQAFENFLVLLFGEVPPCKVNGHYIPFGEYKKTPGKGDALLAGDAAGLVEPITGEGIAFAIQSGHLAALSIIESIATEGKCNALDLYQKKYQAISSALDHANVLKYLVFPSLTQKIFIKALPSSNNLPLKHMDLMADKINYPDYVRYIIKKVFLGLLKRALFLK